jgi:hypothetical protein
LVSNTQFFLLRKYKLIICKQNKIKTNNKHKKKKNKKNKKEERMKIKKERKKTKIIPLQNRFRPNYKYTISSSQQRTG